MSTRHQQNVLVVLLEDGRAPELRRALSRRGDDKSVHVVAPASVGKLQWLTSDEDAAREEASERAAGVIWALSDQGQVDVEQGDADPFQAVEDALREFPADEILIVGGEDDAALELSLGELGLPVSRARGARPPEHRDEVRRDARRITDGRSQATPFAVLAGVNLALLAVVALVVIVVVLAFWLH
jgi:hypothetical protein